MIAALGRWLDDRLHLASAGRRVLDKVFPDHWSFFLGEIALYSFIVLVVTGVFLSFFYDPSGEEVVYRGEYAPLVGERMTAAYRSVVELSFDVRAGLLVRQVHHWAALVFLAVIVAHLLRVFLTGAFRRPRELNWMVGVTLLVLSLFNGFSGYSLPDDLLSGTGLRIAYAVVLSVPVAGPWLAFLLFGGEFPAPEVFSRLFVLHVLIVPLLIAGLITVHLAVIVRQKHTQFAGRGRAEENVVGPRLWPTYAARSLALFAFVAAAYTALGGLAQINPIWLYGPFEPAAVTTTAQPDWFLMWVEGALRLYPPWGGELAGIVVPEIFVPGVVLPLVTFALLYGWPFLEARVTGDRAEHHLLDRPADRPGRTAIALGALTFYGVLVAAVGQDVIVAASGVSVIAVTRTLQVLLLVLPPLVALLTWKVASDAGRHRPDPGEREELPVGPAHPAAAPEGPASPRTAGPGGPASLGRLVAAATGGAIAALGSLAVLAGVVVRRVVHRLPGGGQRSSRR